MLTNIGLGDEGGHWFHFLVNVKFSWDTCGKPSSSSWEGKMSWEMAMHWEGVIALWHSMRVTKV